MGDLMSYLVCEECGKYYELKEGKDSFSYERCSCGGKLRYTDTLNGKNNRNITLKDSKITCNNCGAENPSGSMICSSCGRRLESEQPIKSINHPLNRSVSWTGIAIGFLFLLTTMMFGIIAIFGKNIPQNAADIPYNLLVNFGIIAMILLIISGLISSYIGGSLKFKNGLINGGLVGVILGLIVGATSGSIISIAALAMFGSITGLGGIFGTFLKRRFNKYL
jgi:DNA-directed RNA polymerase subunit RPC12/RpoP